LCYIDIILDADEDGEANTIADEEQVYVAMGFKVADERGEEAAREKIPIPAMSSELEKRDGEATIPIGIGTILICLLAHTIHAWLQVAS
jgi:hypothetical protein